MTALRLGFGLPVSGSWATGPNMAEIARRAEDLGYDSLWTFQRLLHPADGDWGAMYRSVQDPLVALAYVAGLTQRVRLGVAIVNAPYVAPVVLAKALTTLDHVSAGRLDAGLGLGWSREEFAAVGVPYERRGARMDEFLQLLQAIWSEDVVSFEGEFYQLGPSTVDPKPVQRPRPPLLLGGSAEPALRRAGRLADGWISASRHDLTSIGAAIDVVRSAAADAGRDVDALRFVVRGVVRLEDDARDEDGRRPLHGDAEQIRADLAALERAGITEVFLDLNFHPRVGTPDADPAESMEHAHQVLETFAR